MRSFVLHAESASFEDAITPTVGVQYKIAREQVEGLPLEYYVIPLTGGRCLLSHNRHFWVESHMIPGLVRGDVVSYH